MLQRDLLWRHVGAFFRDQWDGGEALCVFGKELLKWNEPGKDVVGIKDLHSLEQET